MTDGSVGSLRASPQHLPPLMQAVISARVERVRELLEKGADPTERAVEGVRALDFAADEGNLALVELLLAHTPLLLDLPGCKEATALMAAARNGHVDLVRVLLQRGADPHRHAADGLRPLTLAALQGHHAVVDLLLAHDPGLMDLPRPRERPAPMAAPPTSSGAPLPALPRPVARKRNADGMRALEGAARAEHLAVVERLLARDPQLLDLPGRTGRTMLMVAAHEGRVELVRVLLRLGADPRLRDGEGAHALDMASQQGDQGVAELLLAHDPQLLDLPGPLERTPLMAAALHGHVPLVHLLLARGADPRRQTTQRLGALGLAAQEGLQAVVDLLLAHHPELLEVTGSRDYAALMAAVFRGRVTLSAAPGEPASA